RVLGVEHVEQRTPADVELLTVGEQHVVGDLRLGLELVDQRGLVDQPAPSGPGVLLGAATYLEQPPVNLVGTVLLLADVGLLDSPVVEVPAKHRERLQVGRAAGKAVDVMTGAGASLEVET